MRAHTGLSPYERAWSLSCAWIHVLNVNKIGATKVSTVAPLKLLSAKALELVGSLEPTDMLVLKRGVAFYGISAEVLSAPDEVEPTPYETFYDWTVKLGYGTPIDVPSTPTITTTFSDQPIQLPTIEIPKASRDAVVIDSVDIAQADNTTSTDVVLEFIRQLEVATGFVDRRSDYINWATRPIQPTLRPKPSPPSVGREHRLYQSYMLAYAAELKLWDAERKIYEQELALYPERLAEWAAKNKVDGVIRTGEHREANLSMHVTSRSINNAATGTGLHLSGNDSDLLAAALLAIKGLHLRLNELDQQLNELRRR